MTIKLTLPDLSETERDAVRQLLADALGEFVDHRGPTAAEYVESRYGKPGSNLFSPAWYADKTSEVERRIARAGKLRLAVHNALDVFWVPGEPNGYTGYEPPLLPAEQRTAEQRGTEDNDPVANAWFCSGCGRVAHVVEGTPCGICEGSFTRQPRPLGDVF